MMGQLRQILAIALLGAGAAVPAWAAHEPLAMLGELEPGSWELRVREAGGGVERICLQDGRSLIQLRHRAANCQRLVVDDQAREVTVQYTCRGQGYGRTHIRRETNRLVQIDSQGIADGLPFAFSAEARRLGDCRSLSAR